MAKAQILVVEDDNIIVIELRDRLQSLGHAVCAVASYGEEAIAKAGEMRPDLVLMDIRLKGDVDGMKAAEQIRARFDIPVVYLTAYADENTLQRAKVTEPYGYIIKPFEERELHTTIEIALYKHKMERELKESRRWLAITLRSIGDAVIATDEKGLVTFMNPIAEALTGWKQEDALGKDSTEVFRIVNEETGILTESPVTKALREGVIVGLANHSILIAKDGTETTIDDSAAPISDDEGKVFGVVLVFRDITERRRMEEALKRRLEQLTSLNRASQAMTASLELDQVLAEIVSLASEVVASDYASVVLVDEEGRLVRGVENLPGVLAIERRIRNEGFTNWIVRSRQAVVVDDIDEDGTVNPRPVNGAQSPDGSTGSPQRPVEGPRTANPFVVEAGVKSFAGLPLVIKDRLLGVLYLYSLRPGNFRDQLPLLTTFANQAAIATENARLYQAEQKRAAQLAVVNQVARQAASTLDLDQLLQNMVTAIQEGFGYYNVVLLLLDEVAGELRMRAIAGGFEDVAAPDYRQAVGVGMVGWTAETGQPLLANDVRQEQRYIPGFLEEVLTRSELCVPLKLTDRVIGVLDIQDTQLNAFDETDLMAMETLADQIAVAIENARLFGETRRRFEETTALYETSLDITGQLEMTELLKAIVERAVTLLRAEAGGIYLYDPERGELRLAIGYDYTEKYVGATLKLGEGMAGKVFRTGEPLIVDDYRTWEGRASAYEADQPFTAALEVPLRWQDRTMGVLAINADARKRTFDQDDAWLATLFANQAAVAIENARIYEEERKRIAQLELIAGITQKIASILDLSELLHQVVHLIRDAFGYYHTGIHLVEADGDEIVLEAGAGLFIEALVNRLRLKIGREGICGWVAQSGEPLLVNDVSQEPRYYPTEESKDVQSELAVPIKLKGEVIGVLDVQSIELNAFDDDDVSILQTLADQLAVAIENARLYEREKRQKARLARFNEITRSINARLDLRTVLAEVVEAVTLILDTEYSTLFLLDAESQGLIPYVTCGHDWEQMKEVRFALGEGLAGWVAEAGQPLNVTDTAADPRFVSISPNFTQFASMLLVPLIHEEKVIGVLTADRKDGGAFSEEDQFLLTTLADQATVAIENARLYEAEAQRRRETETLRHAAMALTSTLDLEETVDRILEQLLGVVAYDSASVQLLREGCLEIVGGRGFGDPSAVIGLRFPVPGDNPNTRVIESGEPVVLADARAAHAPFRQPPHDHIRSWLGVPMRCRERTIGVITLDSTELGHFTADHARLAAAFANQAAVAIENARLYEQIAGLAAEQEGHIQERTSELLRKARDLSFLYQASVDLSSSLEKGEVLNILARQAVLAMDAEDCIIYELQDDALIIVAHHRGSALSRENLVGQRYLLSDYPATREAIERGQPLWVRVDDPLAEEAERAELQKLGYAALLQVHIISGGQVLGVVEVFGNKPEWQFGEDDAALLQTVANQAGMAIEKAHLFQQVRGESNRLALLYDVSRKLSASLDPEQTLRDVFQVSIAATGASRGSVFVFDDEGHVSDHILMRELSPAEAGDVIDLLMRKGLAGWVFRHKQPAIVFDVSQDERWWPIPDDPEPVGSAMAIPFIEHNRVRGLLTLVHPQPHHFNQVHLDLLSSIANQVAGVIERARLYDETQRRAMEVAAQKEQTDAIVQSMADGLIVTDLENRIVLANPAAEALLQFRLEDAIGQDIGISIRDDRLRQIMRVTLDTQQAGHEVDIEMTDPHDGTQRIMRAHTAAVNDPSNQLMGIVTTLRDVTHEREVQRLKDELISTVSHELRTPLTSVLGFSELLLSRQLSEEQRQLYLQTIYKEAERLSALINDFLDIQRMERGQQEYHFEEVDLGEMAREMVATYSGQSEAHTLTLDLPPELPPVQVDPDRLRQVLGNLLSNAVKFSPDGGTVTISAQVLDDAVQVAVSDNGIGIPAEALPRIFEKFFRVDSSDRREIRGTGLGLAICKEIVKAHGGAIWAESQLGAGTTVTFSLPMVAGERILVLDDEEDIREMFQRLLSESYKVATAANGQEGLLLMEEELPDLVILDIAMPVINGYQFLEKVKGDQRMKDIPVIAISGVDTDIDRLKELGADEFLSKPFSGTVLLETMHRLLKGS